MAVDKMGEILWNLYEPRIRDQFKNHPQGELIVDLMKRGELTAEQTDEAFEQAAAHTMRNMLGASTIGREIQHVQGNNSILFEIYGT